MPGVGAVRNSFPQQADILPADALEPGIGHHGGAVVAYHAVPVARRCPFRQKAAFLIMVHQPLLDARSRFRIHQVHQRKQRPEGVPEARIRIERSGAHLAVVRAVVHFFPGRIGLRKVPREQQTAVQAGVESAQVVQVVVFHLYPAQRLVPGRTGLLLNRLQAAFRLLQVQLRLLRRNEGRSHLQIHGKPFWELHQGGVIPGGNQFHGGAGFNQEVIAEAFCHAAVVLHAGSGKRVAVQQFHGSALVGIHHQIGGLPSRILNAESRCMGRWRHLQAYIVIGQIHAVIIGSGGFGLVGEPAGAFFFLPYGRPAYRHQGKCAVIVNPGAGLMRLLDAPDVGGVVAVRPAVAVGSGLRCPGMHAPGHGNGRIGVAGRKVVGRQGSYQRIHIVYRVQHRPGGRAADGR